MNNFPIVSIILPVQNESSYLARCLRAVLSQDYPLEKLEVIIADGMSTDATREIIHSLQSKHTNLRLIDNPRKAVPNALNLAFTESRGEIVVRVDGHCEIEKDYISRCVEFIQQNEVDGVGGYVETTSHHAVGKVIALAMGSFFGVGGSAFRTKQDKTMTTDTIAFPAYTRSIIERAGPFDEEMICNEDDEYNHRLRKIGAKIVLCQDIRSKYYCRNSFSSLWRQYFRYGFWKVRLLQKHPFQMKWRHFVPAIFISVLLLMGILSLFFPLAIYLFGVVAGIYLLVNLAVSYWLTLNCPVTKKHLLPIVFMILHFSYGIGFLAGLLNFGFRRKS